jgi:small subunit ribosomal protein S17
MAEEIENNETEETPVVEAEAAAPEAAATAQPAAPREPQEVVAPKERRRRARAGKAAKAAARKSRTPEERHADRVAERTKKAALRRTERARTRAKTRQGVVISDKADKTITVRIDIARRHRRYEKIVRTSSKLHAHDESNDAHTGDTVIVRECRPMSRIKRWRLIEVVERAE